MVLRRRPKTGKYIRYHIPLTREEIDRLKLAAIKAGRSSRSFAAEVLLKKI